MGEHDHVEHPLTDRLNRTLVPEGARRCPICHANMQSELMHGVLIDVCEAHGVWLDRNELFAIARIIRESPERSRQEWGEHEAPSYPDAPPAPFDGLTFEAIAAWIDRAFHVAPQRGHADEPTEPGHPKNA